MVKLGLASAAVILAIVGVVTWVVTTTAAPTPVFEGVSGADLAAIGVIVVDDGTPSWTPVAYDEGELRRSIIAANNGAIIENTQFVRISVARGDEARMLTDAIAFRVDTSRVLRQDYFGPPPAPLTYSDKPVIMFVNPRSGRPIATLYR